MQTFTGTEYLKIDVAGNFDGKLDKLDWADRIEWTDQNDAQLEALTDQAESPAQFFAGVQALRAAQQGKPSGYAISLDATASGMQILAALTGCQKTGKLTNIVNTGHRVDPYTALYGSMAAQIGAKATISRDDTKSAIMKAFYTSKREPKRVFGEGELLDIFFRTLATETPGAWALNEHMEAIWDPEAREYVWQMPDGFTVRQEVEAERRETVSFLNQPYEVKYRINAPTPKGRSLGANLAHSCDGFLVREITRRAMFKPEQVRKVLDDLKGIGTSTDRPQDEKLIDIWTRYQASGFLSLRCIDFIDRQNAGLVDGTKVMEVIKTLPNKPFKLATNHDCFRVLPNYGNQIRTLYNQVMSEVAGSNMLQDILSQIRRKPEVVNKMGDLSAQCKEAEYAIC